MSTSRGLRNNNPGNIRISKDKWQGLKAKQTDKSFFQFISIEYGYRALIRTLQNYRKLYNLKTVAELIKRWAPENENNTAGYITRVCREMQVPSTCVPDINDKNMMCAFAAAISQVENDTPANMEDVRKGWDLL